MIKSSSGKERITNSSTFIGSIQRHIQKYIQKFGKMQKKPKICLYTIYIMRLCIEKSIGRCCPSTCTNKKENKMLTLKKLQEQINQIKKEYYKKPKEFKVDLLTENEQEAIKDLKTLGWKEIEYTGFGCMRWTRLQKEVIDD